MDHPLPDNCSNPLQDVLSARYSDAPKCDAATMNNPMLRNMASRGSCRNFSDQPVPDSLVQTICATALAAPTKSDLQQRDIIVMRAPEQRKKLSDLIPGHDWVNEAPVLMVVCGNNRRQRQLHQMHDIPFANDHFDAAFNAIGDAAIGLAALVYAAEASGLGCCPISAIRNQAAAVSDLLGLPDHVFPFAGLAIGYPAKATEVSKRLPLSCTVHTDRYNDSATLAAISSYDRDRDASQPYSKQRLSSVFGQTTPYPWSLDKARQYSQPERQNFGAYIRSIGFRLD